MEKKKSGKLKYAVLLAVFFAGGYLYLNLGGLITRTAEKIASGALGVAVNIGSIDVSLADKNVTVNTLQIGNPPGYKNKYAITSEKIHIGLNTASKQLIDFKDIRVEGSVVNLEVNEHGSNLLDLKKLAAGKPQKESVGSEQVRVIVQNMVIGASTLNPSVTLLNREIKPIKMPALNISGIGKGGGGVAAGDAIVQILGKYINAAQSQASQAGMLQGLPTNVGDVGKAIEELDGNRLKGLFK